MNVILGVIINTILLHSVRLSGKKDGKILSEIFDRESVDAALVRHLCLKLGRVATVTK